MWITSPLSRKSTDEEADHWNILPIYSVARRTASALSEFASRQPRRCDLTRYAAGIALRCVPAIGCVFWRKVLPALENPVVAEDVRFARRRRLHWPLSATGTLFALGLNYANHASGLAFYAAEKAAGTFIKAPTPLPEHHQTSVRPGANVEYMHYEAGNWSW